MDQTQRIPYGEPDITLLDEPPLLVYLRTATPRTEAEGEESVVMGSGYDSYESASEACRKWYCAVRVGLAKLHFGGTFYVNNLEEADWDVSQTREAQDWETGVRVIEDERRQLVFKTEPPGRWHGAMPLSVVKSVDRLKLTEAISDIAARRAEISHQLEIACDLYGRSVGMEMSDARVVVLVTCVEALIDQQPMPQEVRSLLRLVGKVIGRSDVSSHWKQKLQSQLGGWKSESIKDAGRRYTQQIAPYFSYYGYGSAEFFGACYDLRSEIVHGSRPQGKPGQDDSELLLLRNPASVAPVLEILVGEVIAAVSTGTIWDAPFRIT